MFFVFFLKMLFFCYVVHFFVLKKTNQKKAVRKLYLHSVLVIFAVLYSSLFAPHSFLRFAKSCGYPPLAGVSRRDGGGKPHPVRDASLGRKKCTKKIAFHRNATLHRYGLELCTTELRPQCGRNSISFSTNISYLNDTKEAHYFAVSNS